MSSQRISEKELQAAILDLAHRFGWLSFHAFDSRRSQAGFPDLVLVRPPTVLYRELKGERKGWHVGELTPEQSLWLLRLTECGQDAKVWTAQDWRDGIVERELR